MGSRVRVPYAPRKGVTLVTPFFVVYQAIKALEVDGEHIKIGCIFTGNFINRKTFCDAFPNHFVSILHLLTQNELRFLFIFQNHLSSSQREFKSSSNHYNSYLYINLRENVCIM